MRLELLKAKMLKAITYPKKKNFSELDSFIEEHKSCSERNEIIISTTQTGVGVVVECKCKTCGFLKNITDYDLF